MTEWTKARPDVLAMAERLIEKDHKHLLAARIGFLFRDKAPVKQGMKTLGKASKVPENLKPYLALDFIIWLSEEDWDDSPQAAREALLDHELCHCGEGKDGWRIRPHEIEEFVEILKRHGAWNVQLTRAKDYIQDTLPGVDVKGSVVAVDPDALTAAENDAAAAVITPDTIIPDPPELNEEDLIESMEDEGISLSEISDAAEKLELED